METQIVYDLGSMPDWIGAVSTAIAVGIAIFVPWFQHHLESRAQAREQASKSDALALIIYFQLKLVRAQLVNSRQRIDWLQNRDHAELQLEAPRLTITAADQLESGVRESWIMGTFASDFVVAAWNAVQRFNFALMEFRSAPDERAQELKDDVVSWLEASEEVVPKAMQMVGRAKGITEPRKS